MHSLETIIKLNTPKEVAKAQAYARALNGAPTLSQQKCRDSFAARRDAILAALNRRPLILAFWQEMGNPWRLPKKRKK